MLIEDLLNKLEELGLQESQIVFIVTQITKGNIIFLEQLKNGRFYRTRTIKNLKHVPIERFRICDTWYYEVLIKYSNDISTIENLIDLIQVTGYESEFSDRPNALRNYKQCGPAQIRITSLEAGLMNAN